MALRWRFRSDFEGANFNPDNPSGREMMAVRLRGRAAKKLRDPNLPSSTPQFLSSSGVAATAMTVRMNYLGLVVPFCSERPAFMRAFRFFSTVCQLCKSIGFKLTGVILRNSVPG
ncbi:MAG: hypothetical protein HZC43_06335 [Nitrosomonadales bacterium]|nr:hypothetical protein [Nitrosomonadales bacterium]